MPKILVMKSNKKESGYESEIKSIEVGNRKVEYELLRKEIGGYIELANFSTELMDAGIDMFCDEEGKLKGLSPTVFVFRGEERELVDIVCGNVILAARKDNGQTHGLSTQQIKKVREILKVIEFTVNGEKSRFFSLRI